MSRKLPVLTGEDVLRALKRGGFYVHHVKGSHHSLRHPSKPALRVVVPVHRHELPRGTLAAIIKQAGLTLEEFLEPL